MKLAFMMIGWTFTVTVLSFDGIVDGYMFSEEENDNDGMMIMMKVSCTKTKQYQYISA